MEILESFTPRSNYRTVSQLMLDFVTVSVTNQIKTTNQNLISSPTDLLHSLQTLQKLVLYNHLDNPLENNLLFCMSISCSEMDFFYINK